MTKTFNLVIILFCLTIMFISARELFFHPLENSLSKDFPSIGQINNLQNTVKLKKFNFFNWDDGFKDSTIRENDLIYTHKDSSVDIHLNSGTQLSLSAETLIQIENSNKININSGEVNLHLSNSKQKLQINLRGTTYLISTKSKETRVKIKNIKNQSELIVSSGTLLLSKKDNKTISLTTDQSLIIQEDREKIILNSIQLLSPKDRIYVSSLEKSKVIFKAKIENIKETQLQVSKDREFSKILIEENYTPNKPIEFLPGEYFWRLSQTLYTTPWESFKVIQTIPKLELLFPINNYEENYYGESTILEFKWDKHRNINSYLFEVFDQHDDLVYSKETTKNQITWESKSAGQFSWRITSNSPFIEATPSEKRTIILKKITYSQTEPLVIELTKPNQKVVFDWKKSKNSPYSKFELSNDPNFKEIIINKKVLSNQTKITFPKVGVYYWRTYSYTKAGKKLLNTPIKVKIQPTPPPKKPIRLPNLKLKLQTKVKSNFFYDFILSRAFAQNIGKVNLDWKSISDAKTYEVEIYTDNKLKHKIKTIKSKNSFYKWEVPRTGNFYWRYRYQDYWGRYSPYSDISELLITGKIFKEKIVTQTNPKIIKEISPKEKKNQDEIGLFYMPGLISFEDKKEDNYNIKGASLNGFKFIYSKKLKDKRELVASLRNQTGLVFNNEKFFLRSLDLNYQIPYKAMAVYIGPRAFQISSYKTQGTKAVYDQGQTSLQLNIGGKYHWQNTGILTDFSLSIGEVKILNLNASYEFYNKDQYNLWALVGLENLAGDIQDHSFKSQQFQLAIGSFYSF